MGYYTNFELKVHKGNADIKHVIRVGAGICDYFYHAFDENGETQEPSKWYYHEDSMRKVSKLFPDIVLLLHGEGEEGDDVWNKYFLNGKMQYCPATFVFEDFDEDKLK